MSGDMAPWIKVGHYDKHAYLKTKTIIDDNDLVTVCVEANCPNRYECFASGTATFMILGDTCTRNCRYCNIKKGVPRPLDEGEPERIANAVRKLGLDYAVITCVTRDDLEDGGAQQFVETLNSVRDVNPGCRVELLISDLNGDWGALEQIIAARPDVLNHNIEVVRELFLSLRPKGRYSVSLKLLKRVKELNPDATTKSGFMVGLGETYGQIMRTIRDLKAAGCEILTVGQYLQPGPEYYEVKKYYSPEEFEVIRKKAREAGFKHVVAGPLVRSSYKAGEMV